MQTIKRLLLLIIMLSIIGLIGYGVYRFNRPSQPYSFNMSSETVIKEIRSLERLETAQFTIEKVIDAGTSGNKFQEFIYGDRILFIAHGQVIAGFNLANLASDSIQVNGTTLALTLPPPMILITTLDNEQSRVYDRKLGLLTKGDTTLESKAREEAEKAIREAACTGKILEEASKNAKSQLTALFKALKFTEVIITIPSGSCGS